MLGAEPELTALEDGARVHSSVRERVVQGDVTYAALYPCLAAGRYRLDGTGPVVTVASGEAAEVSWPVS
jgi:hypothetical protein